MRMAVQSFRPANADVPISAARSRGRDATPSPVWDDNSGYAHHMSIDAYRTHHSRCGEGAQGMIRGYRCRAALAPDLY